MKKAQEEYENLSTLRKKIVDMLQYPFCAEKGLSKKKKDKQSAKLWINMRKEASKYQDIHKLSTIFCCSMVIWEDSLP